MFSCCWPSGSYDKLQPKEVVLFLSFFADMVSVPTVASAADFMCVQTCPSSDSAPFVSALHEVQALAASPGTLEGLDF